LICSVLHVCFLQAESYEVQSVMVGEPVTLNSNTFEIQLKNEIEWRFNNSRIAKAMNGNPTYDKNERFKDRLKLERNGSLTITNTRTTDTGVYKFSTIINGKDSSKTFSVTVYGRSPVSSIPVITKNSSSPKCVLLCSVMNVSRVTLSWYKGNGSLSSINVSDLSISLSLPLEVEYQDKNTYSCVVSNPISYKTRHACITDLCRLCSGMLAVIIYLQNQSRSEEVSCCESTEAVIRLAVTALVGLAAAAAFIVLVYDIRSRRVEQERHQTQSDGPDTLKQE
uniref:Ig-like domain-containing protein n=1 Tax=Sinocyclocheilus rhinocerous TaxID=307959 RepID=A0A673ISG3_9TELE